jgi:ribose 5-phosphate isomerase A
VVRPLADFARFDLAVDGADEVAPNLDLVKGGGGAHTKEKIVAAAAARFVVVVDQTKLVDALGDRCPVPIEVVPDGLEFVSARLIAAGAKVAPRKGPGGHELFVTELGNRILDARYGRIADAAALARQLDAMPGVVEHGLFLGLASLVLVGEFGHERVRKLAAPPTSRARRPA